MRLASPAQTLAPWNARNPQTMRYTKSHPTQEVLRIGAPTSTTPRTPAALTRPTPTALNATRFSVGGTMRATTPCPEGSRNPCACNTMESVGTPHHADISEHNGQLVLGPSPQARASGFGVCAHLDGCSSSSVFSSDTSSLHVRRRLLYSPP